MRPFSNFISVSLSLSISLSISFLLSHALLTHYLLLIFYYMFSKTHSMVYLLTRKDFCFELSRFLQAQEEKRLVWMINEKIGKYRDKIIKYLTEDLPLLTLATFYFLLSFFIQYIYSTYPNSLCLSIFCLFVHEMILWKFLYHHFWNESWIIFLNFFWAWWRMNNCCLSK